MEEKQEKDSINTESSDSSSNRFTPNFFIEIGKEGVESKIKALEAYKGVMLPYPHLLSYEALATYRGCQAEVKYAEAFEVVFRVG